VTYSHNDYGEHFADVYDEWYSGLDDIDEFVGFMVDLADSQPVLELGVGTGRLAVPLSRHVPVVGIDNSAAMVARLLARNDADPRLAVTVGHMVRDMPRGHFAVVLLAYNTLFNLLEVSEQGACLAASAERLLPGGHVVVDCFVPDDELLGDSTLVHRGGTTVQSNSWVDTEQQRMGGTFVDDLHNERMWEIRYATPQEIDEMAATAGLVLEERYASYGREPFTSESTRHISVYGRAPRHTT
jgi:SAM-dependent methyltransferase